MEFRGELGEVLFFLQQMAREAGQIMLRRWQSPMEIQMKANGTPVSSVDLEISAILQERIQQQFSDLALWSEESGALTPPYPARGLIVDELDGTYSYINKRPGFTFQAAYFEQFEDLKLGLIYDPVRDLMLYGAKGMGVYIQTGSHTSLVPPPRHKQWDQLKFAHHRQFFTETYQRMYGELGIAPQRIVPTGSIGSKSIDFAFGKVDAMVALNRNIPPWDWAPGKVILEELGYRLLHLNQEPVDLAAHRYGEPFGYIVCPSEHLEQMQEGLNWIYTRLKKRKSASV